MTVEEYKILTSLLRCYAEQRKELPYTFNPYLWKNGTYNHLTSAIDSVINLGRCLHDCILVPFDRALMTYEEGWSFEPCTKYAHSVAVFSDWDLQKKFKDALKQFDDEYPMRNVIPIEYGPDVDHSEYGPIICRCLGIADRLYSLCESLVETFRHRFEILMDKDTKKPEGGLKTLGFDLTLKPAAPKSETVNDGNDKDSTFNDGLPF